jgi:Tol biopolymer transport system component
MKRRLLSLVLSAALVMGVAAVSALAGAVEYGPWSQALRVEDAPPGADPGFNGAFLDGCPFIARDGRSFFMARGPQYGGEGGIDIWVATRKHTDEPWGAPVNLGPELNSSSNDFCPTLDRDGHRFFFVSNRPGGCGGDDIYTSRRKGDGWYAPQNAGCEVDGGPNSAGNEAGPSPLPERGEGKVLYFSSTRSGSGDIYRSEREGHDYGVAEVVAELSTASVEGQPNLRRDGLEIFFFSNREGSNDIYSATRPSVDEPWSTPVNLGPSVNTGASETRPSLSWDGTALYFGSNRPGGDGDSDHYVTTRERIHG